MDFAGTAARKLLRGAAAADYSFSLRPLGKDIFASARGVAAAITRGVSFSLRQLVKDNFASLLAELASVAHKLFLPLEALWNSWWTQIAVSVFLAVALVILILLVAAALVIAGAYFLSSVAATGAVMMKAPGAAGFFISRAAFHLLLTVDAKAAAVAFAAL